MEHKRLRVAIIGGGIGGLTCAIYLRRAGHDVTVFEYKTAYTETNSGGGINLTANALRCLQDLVGKDALQNATDSHDEIFIRRHEDGAIIHTVTDSPHSMAHRLDILLSLLGKAQDCGVKIVHGPVGTVEAFKDGSDEALVFSNNEQHQCDLIIGSDGINSRVRKALFPGEQYEAFPTGSRTWLVNLPDADMMKNPILADIYDHGKQPFEKWVGPERYIIAWTMTRRATHHLQFSDLNFHPELAIQEGQCDKRWSRRVEDMTALHERWQDWSEGVRQMLATTTDCIEWRIAEVPELPAWSSTSRRVVLIGDAAHAFAPYAGQGACMAIEDAAVLGLLLAQSNKENFAAAIEAYEKLRRPRIDTMRRIVHGNTKVYSMVALSDKISESDEGKNESTWPLDKQMGWITGYDAAADVADYLRGD